MTYKINSGTPWPLGAHFTGSGVNFALFSANAEKVELCLFDASGKQETDRIALPEHNDRVWHGFVEGLEAGQLYGYRVYGPYDPNHGHRFNGHKLLLDPYARAHVGELVWDDALFGYQVGHENEDYSFDERDSAPFMPKCRVEAPSKLQLRVRDFRPLAESVIYEAHLKGFTFRHPAIPENIRGTFAGMAHQDIVAYIKNLGITALELLPVQAFVRDRFLVDKGLSNYWGYNSIGYFAPHTAYLATGALDEVRNCVKRFQDAGIQVLLDVVYNHTAEGNHLGPTLSFRGIDNASYYRLSGEDPRFYYDTTGCGNTLNFTHPNVLQLVTDSLRYWSGEIGVDGFRFDLATTLSREHPWFDNNSGFCRAIRQDPALAGVKMIAEPWDIGDNGYQLGGFPPGWSEWNGKYRDTLRSFWKGEMDLLPELASCVAGSANIFGWRGNAASSSVNFITAHDGFTLYDLVAYNEPHNDANQEQSGHGDNRSWNCGAEGATDDAAINDLRARQQRNFIASLLFSQGAPMILAGDESSNSQQGNNNAYCQDNEITWLDWQWNDARRDLHDFVRHAIALRHAHPALRRTRYFTDGEQADMIWLTPQGTVMQEADWGAGFAEAIGALFSDEKQENWLLLLFNAWHEDLEFTLPDADKHEWTLLTDTAQPAATHSENINAAEPYNLRSRSLVLIQRNSKAS